MFLSINYNILPTYYYGNLNYNQFTKDLKIM